MRARGDLTHTQTLTVQLKTLLSLCNDDTITARLNLNEFKMLQATSDTDSTDVPASSSWEGLDSESRLLKE